jgi:hypothetical protein
MKPQSRTLAIADYLAIQERMLKRPLKKMELAEKAGVSPAGITKVTKAIESGRDFRVERLGDGKIRLWEMRSPWREVAKS